MSLNMEQAVEEVLRLIGMEMYVNQEWIIRKKAGMTMRESEEADNGLKKMK